MRLFQIKTDGLAIFKERLNKYLAIVDIVEPFQEKDVNVHIHDPGRLTEILFSGNKILIKYENKPQRKTKWDAIAGIVDNRWVLIHSNYHRNIAEALLNSRILPFTKNINSIKAEPKVDNGRLDFLLLTEKNEKIWVEVKGCTLAEGNFAIFPDAPTVRGKKHLKQLLELNKTDTAKLIILIFNSNVDYFIPNTKTDPEFSAVFYECLQQLEIYPVVLDYNIDTGYISFKKIVSVK